jgi:diguanylate cyclase (GGDEF)-like protein/PAS domain S-box-containing protein
MDLTTVTGAIRQSERRYRSLVENASDLFVICAEDGSVRYVSPSLNRLLGIDPSEVIGLASTDIHHPEDLPRVIEAFEQALTCERVNVDFRVRHRDGSWRWLELTVTNLLDDPDVEGFVLNGRDVTERRRAEEALRISEERWRALLLNSTDAITVLAADGAVLYTSPSTEGLLGYDPATMVAMPVFELVHPDDLKRAAVILGDLLSSSEVSEPIEMRVMHADGTYRWIECVANNLLDDPVVNGIVVNVRDVTERRRAQDELARQAMCDSLTGLPNRALLLDRLASALARGARTETLTAVLFLDLDHFKLVNDSLGHALGDQLLVTVAERLEQVLRRGDTAARLGGDEFVLCCEEVGSEEEVAEIADRVAAVLAEPVLLDNHELTVTASIGITCASNGARKPEELLRDSDVAMYRAKERGRARAEVFQPSMRTRARARLEQQLDVRRALASGQFRMNYQPVVSLVDGRLVGAEALVRWAHPRRGLVLPGEFIPAAEETGLIEPLGSWVLAESIAEAAAWNRDRRDPIGVSVNLSARQLVGGTLPDLIATTLELHGLEPASLCLEITEGILMEEPEHVVGVLQELSALGVHLAIDDFGTGYSSLAYLKRFPTDILKVDRAFVDGIEHQGENRAIVTAVLALGTGLGMTVVAEGVETKAQSEALQELGCAVGQGFYFSTPVPPETFAELLLAEVAW